MRTQRAGLEGRLAWLATPERERAAWSIAPVGWGGGPRRSGNRVATAGWGLELGGKAFALTSDRTTWGGADFIAADAMVAEYLPLDRLAWLKDTADDRTPGVHPWDEAGATTADQQPNIRRAKPLEGAVLRGAAVGPGFHREHVLFLNRAHLIAHHREKNPPINSTEISDPGTGDGDWTAGLHSLTRVRPWVDSFCQSGRSTSSAEPELPLFSALLNFTKSAGDNTGWGGAHFAKSEAVLSAEAFGFAHPADDGQHDLGMPDEDGAAMIQQGGLHVTRTLFGDTDRGILYSPAEFVNRPWRRGQKGPFVQRVEWREDENATHGTRCGDALGMKKWMSWSPFTEYGPPTTKLKDPGGVKDGDPGGVKSIYPTMLVPPETPRPSVTTPDEIESPSMYGHPIPNGPDAPGTSDWPEGGYSNDGPSYATFADEVDALWMDRYKFTERQFNQQPLTGHGIWHAQYENATPAEGKLERWRPVKSRLEELSFDDDGWITGRTAALGPGGIMYAGSDTLLHELYTTINPISEAPRNAFSLSVFSAAHSGGLQVADGQIGLGSLKPDVAGIVKGARLRLDFGRNTDPNIADLAIDFVDEEGVTQTDRQLWLGGALRLPEVSAPGTPASGKVAIYAKSNGLVYSKDDAGTETLMSGGSGGSGDMLAANNLSDLASDDTAIKNLVSGATSRVPALTDTFPYNDAGDATGGKATLQQIFDRIDDLNIASLGLSSPIAAYESGGKKTTPQAVFNLINSLTAETAPVAADKVPIYDASASQTDAVTLANLLGSSRCVTIDYSGSGSSGKTVTLTGINRAHHLFIARNDASCNDATWWFAGGSTGTIRRIAFSSPTGGTGTECSLDAPAAGTSQVLTINTTAAWINASGVSYRIFVVGTPI